ncbi:TIR domain-containing protein [Streptomyces antimycoticus]|uniref:hypothetical protein n=1 Tax=Streptomyces antimycoticus TaxID=68175 RepID=UPI0025711213|nr:hypothetical protein [Streptomyces antimycoticus]WJD95036.1 hypothetical protein QR300_03005 [Streptomyces antimycoticus]
MPADVTVVRAGEPFPGAWSASLYLCGPTARNPDTPLWRDEALRRIRELVADGGPAGHGPVVFLPEPEPGRPLSYEEHIAWEEEAMGMSDVILFYVPRALPELPGLVTNVKWGAWHRSGRAVLGSPPEARRNEYLLHFAREHAVPVANSLEKAVAEALRRLGTGARRRAGERWVPLHLWRTPEFRRWYGRETGGGRTLRSAEVLWTRGSPAREWAVRGVWEEPGTTEATVHTLVVHTGGSEVLGGDGGED